MTATINMNAYDTWLDPYIGWEFKIVKVTKTKIYFLIDCGFGKFRTENCNKELFDF